MISQLIEDYGLIGDGKTAALVGRDGSLDWLCWPGFDGEACFAALLGTDDNGRWSIAPHDVTGPVTRRYQKDTVVLETDFEAAEGAVRLVDFMPVGRRTSSVIRIVVGLRGTVAMRLALNLRFDYGRLMPWVEPIKDGFIAKVGPHIVNLQTPIPILPDHTATTAEFVISEGQRLPFVLSYGALEGDDFLNPETLLTGTQDYWREWIARFTKSTQWPDAVRRSLLTLRTLIDHATGGLVAAPTTSLPETPGGSLNWDYRFCWLRDATFTVAALVNAGYHQEATEWRDWILRAVAADPSSLRIMYRVDGRQCGSERTIDWLQGYRWAVPVRIGNAAVTQRQVDVYGELIDAMEFATRAGIPQSDHGRHVEREIVTHLEAVWDMAGQGLWESRGVARHYTYSRVMAWVGVDRFLRSAERHGHADLETLKRLRELRCEIHAEICREGYDPGLGTFVQHYGSQELDACLLLLPIVGFLPADDPRMARTISAIENDLVRDGFVFRTVSELNAGQGAFLACTCWLADCRRMQGRAGAAREALERVLSVGNDLGLLSEAYDLKGKHLSGNFPQALTHLAILNTALSLGEDVQHRGGA
jgi:GH15 family glucan-1,4-alpha-glucosidase